MLQEQVDFKSTFLSHTQIMRNTSKMLGKNFIKISPHIYFLIYDHDNINKPC